MRCVFKSREHMWQNGGRSSRRTARTASWNNFRYTVLHRFLRRTLYRESLETTPILNTTSIYYPVRFVPTANLILSRYIYWTRSSSPFPSSSSSLFLRTAVHFDCTHRSSEGEHKSSSCPIFADIGTIYWTRLRNSSYYGRNHQPVCGRVCFVLQHRI